MLSLRYQEPIVRDTFRRRWTIRAWGLFISSILCITRGVLYLPPVATGKEPLPLGIGALADLIPSDLGMFYWQPVWVLGALWFGVGVAGLVDVLRGRRGHGVFLLMVSLFVFWACGYLGATLALGSRSGWASGMLFFAIAFYTNLFRRMMPTVKITPELIRERIRVEADVVYFLHDGEWVEIYPEAGA